MTGMILQFRDLFNYSDLKRAPFKSKKSKKNIRDIERKLQMQAPLYAIKKLMLKKSMHVKEENIIAY
jgi:hypothetical protein